MKRILLVFLSLSFICSSCGDGGGEGDGRTDGDVIADETIPSECDEPFDPLNPEMKMIMLDIQSPENLKNETLLQLIATGFSSGDFIWLFKFIGVDDGSTDSDGSLHILTGTGLPIGDPASTDCYEFANDPAYPNAEANMSIEGDQISWPASQEKIDITIPLYQTDPSTGEKKHLLDLPLKEVEIRTGSFSSDRKTIGTSSECGAELNGKITVEDAKSVVIEQIGVTLCGLLSNDKGDPSDPGDDCQRPMSQWSVPPDEEYHGEPAYKMSGCFSAKSVVITN